ncbi:MAG: EAL domain-containing protein [Gammaproteobacteria bacterium]|jgi:diguanylate cyclase (GGDEF)-like protein/PAS domain S-box-containing protein|nr:EAL domain-containing protein [Gammaproteobacteria bacterium]
MALIKFTVGKKIHVFINTVIFFSLLLIGFAFYVYYNGAILNNIVAFIILLIIALSLIVATILFFIRYQALCQNEERLNMALWSSNEILFDWDIQHDDWYVDDGFEALLGYTPDQFPTKKSSFTKLMHPQDTSLLDQKFLELLAGDVPILIEEFRLQHQAMHWCWVLVRAKVVNRNKYGRALRVVGTFMDITERKKADINKFKKTEDQLHYLTHFDALTGLPNRMHFMVQLESALKRADSLQKEIALIFVGLDNFKMINDTYGHDLGDSLLQAVAKRLLRFIDREGYVARITGDEFALIVENVHSRHNLQNFARTLLDLLGANFMIKKNDIILTASLGICIYPEDATDMDNLFLQADTALYHAKQIGRNGFQFYTSGMNSQVQARQRIERLLKSALDNEEFTLLFQPKIETKTGRVCGAEALVRWNNPELGRVSPTEFIPIAEESGIIIPLGIWVLQNVCEKIKKWHGLGFGHLKVAVNLSAYQFRTGDIVEDIAKILHDSTIPAYALDLELTEGVLMENSEKCILMLQVLKNMGITISVDDFGTGYSSLSYLRRFPIDALKIDKSFIRNICTDPEDESIVKAIIAMAKGLKIRVIAEGVETKEQVQYLIEQEVNELQGFYFSKPLTEDELTSKLYEDTAQLIAFKD